jgi:hypothetical protein
MKVAFLFHGNLNYSNMPIERRDWVIDTSYGALIKFWNSRFPGLKWNIEHAGWDVDYMAQNTPHIIEEERKILGKSLEFVGAPYGHSILANYPYQDGVHALQFSMESYQNVLGVKPRVMWNPEGAWNRDVPRMAKAAGFDAMFVDWDSYLRCNDEKVRASEDTGERAHVYADLTDEHVNPTDKSLHFPMPIIPGLTGIMRTDRVSRHMLCYLMGDKKVDMNAIMERYTAANEGYLVVYAEDAEYCGTTGWYFMKYHSLSSCFDPIPESFGRLETVIQWMLDHGHEIVNLSDIIDTVPHLKQNIVLKDGMAWHGAYAEAWSSTPSSKVFDAIGDRVREKIKRAEAKAVTAADKEKVRQAWKHLICSQNSDGRWPPPPVNPAQWNLDFCSNNLVAAEKIADSLLK